MNGHYDTIDSFAEDVRLVFINTRTYNKPDSDIVYMAKILEEIFERKFGIIKATGGDELEEGIDLFVFESFL
jgi:Bromodomain